MIFGDWSVWFHENVLKMPQFNRKYPSGAEKNKEIVRKQKVDEKCKGLLAGADPGGAIVTIAPPKTYISNFVHHDILQFGKQHSRYKTILPSTVLSQQCC